MTAEPAALPIYLAQPIDFTYIPNHDVQEEPSYNTSPLLQAHF